MPGIFDFLEGEIEKDIFSEQSQNNPYFSGMFGNDQRLQERPYMLDQNQQRPPEAPQAPDYSKDSRKGIGKFLGDLADTLLMLDGGAPAFANANKQKRLNEAASNIKDPNELARVLGGIDYTSGQEFQKQQQKFNNDTKQLQLQGMTAGENLQDTIDKKMKPIIGILGTVDSQAKLDYARPIIQKMVENGGLTLPFELPQTYDKDAFSVLRSQGMAPKDIDEIEEKRRMNDNLIGDRAHDNAINRGNLRVRGIQADQANANQSRNAASNEVRAATGVQNANTAVRKEQRIGSTKSAIAKIIKSNPGVKIQQKGDLFRYSTDGGKTWKMGS